MSALQSVPVTSTARGTPEQAARINAVWAVLHAVPDPEVPAVSVCDLGIVREVLVAADERLEVVLTPTYSGCPATEVIEQDVLAAIAAVQLGPAYVTLRRAPAWTTDWISVEGKRKLTEYGIAPPGAVSVDGAVPIRFMGRSLDGSGVTIACPRCASKRTERLSAFGATACKALYRCLVCREPFEYFKPI